MGLPPHLDPNADNKATVLPGKGVRQGRREAMKPLPPVDHTIRIPTRLALKCWHTVFLCTFIAAIGIADARVPDFRQKLSNGVDAVLYRLSLESVQAQAAKFYGGLVDWGVNVALPEE